MNAAIIETIVSQHAEEAAFLWLLRDAAVRAPHYRLKDLARLDNRVEAHLDGLRIAGDAGRAICTGELAHQEPGEVFAAAVLALEARDAGGMREVYAVVEAVPETARGLVSAFGWVAPERLSGTVRELLADPDPFRRALGIAACRVHRVDPGAHLPKALAADHPGLRSQAARTAGELGRKGLLSEVRPLLRDEDEGCRFWSAWGCALLGDRSAAAPALAQIALSDSPFADRALHLLARALSPEQLRSWLAGPAQQPTLLRQVIQASGWSGDPVYAPWLLRQMAVPEVARVAGEAFSMITGVDLAYEDLEGEWPDGFQAGPTEDAEDETVALDPDEDLPWPDRERVSRWWDANASRFLAATRYLAGSPITESHCRQVLLDGYQRQRTAAALELSLMAPGTPLFEARAPGPRQQRLLRGSAHAVSSGGAP